MKNKVLTYVLGAAVLTLWGLIVYRIFSAISSNHDDSQPVAANMIKEPYNDYTIPKDTTRLLLNYKDPFRLTKQKDTVQAFKKELHKEATTVAKPAVNWGFIKYSGYIRNPGSKKLIAILTINGQNVTMAEGETSYNVKLLKNMRDSIKISYNGKIKYVTMHQVQL